MLAAITTNIWSIIAVLFTIIMTKRHILENKQNVMYYTASIYTCILLLLEIASAVLDYSTNVSMVIPNRIVNMAGYILTPLVPYVLLRYCDMGRLTKLHRGLLKIPLAVNAVLSIFSYETGWIFYVNSQNHYTRGPFLFIPILICMFYYVLIIRFTYKAVMRYEEKHAFIFGFVVVLPLLAAVVQLFVQGVIIVWNSVALALLLYFILLRELQFTYDMQTGVKNRAVFEKQMEEFDHARNAAIVMFDLNYLKQTNDRYGHKAGDDMIATAARVIKEAFCGIGKTFRIGGDEFCVICPEPVNAVLCSTISRMEDTLKQINKTREHKIELAYGYSIYRCSETESIHTAFIEADRKMYEHKARIKGQYGRRSTDTQSLQQQKE